MKHLGYLIAFQMVLFAMAGVVVKRSSEDADIRDILLEEKDPMLVVNENITSSGKDGMYEGDILMLKKEAAFLYGTNRTNTTDKRDATIAKSLPHIGALWPGKRIPILISKELAKEKAVFAAVNAAVAEIQSKSCIKIPKRTARDRNYVYITKGHGCSSRVGMHRGKQVLSLASAGCWFKETATHELMHALGFLHEQARPDRDDHVRVLKQNIIKNRMSTFDKYDRTVVDSLGEAYDYNSIMHYWRNAFTRNGRPTIIRKGQPKYILGVTDMDGGLSDSDAKQLNLLYKCPRRRSAMAKEAVGQDALYYLADDDDENIV